MERCDDVKECGLPPLSAINRATSAQVLRLSMRTPSEASRITTGHPSEITGLLSEGRETEAVAKWRQPRDSGGQIPLLSLLAVLVVLGGARWIYDDYVQNPVVVEPI